MTLWNAILWLHLLAMAFFVGGQMFLAGVVVPVHRGGRDREALRAIARGFGYGTLVAIAVAFATGAAMASHFGLWQETKLQVKLGLVVLAAVLIVWHMRRPTWHALEGAIFVVSLAIVWLGIALTR